MSTQEHQNPTIGELIPNGKEENQYDFKRDAIHIAVIPLVAAEILIPGQHITINDMGQACGSVLAPIGIVDPYIMEGKIKPGQKFWMFLYPKTVTNLRHDWEHPVFKAVEEKITNQVKIDKKASEIYLINFAGALGLTCSNLIRRMTSILGGEEDWIHLNFDIPDYDPVEAWMHFEIITGLNVENKNKNFISCAC